MDTITIYGQLDGSISVETSLPEHEVGKTLRALSRKLDDANVEGLLRDQDTALAPISKVRDDDCFAVIHITIHDGMASSNVFPARQAPDNMTKFVFLKMSTRMMEDAGHRIVSKHGNT